MHADCMTRGVSTHSEIIALGSTRAKTANCNLARQQRSNSLPLSTFSKNVRAPGCINDSLSTLTAFVVRSRTQALAIAVDIQRLRGPPRAVSHCELTQWHRWVAWEMRKSRENSGQRTGASDAV